MKLSSELMHGENKLWCHVIRAKYENLGPNYGGVMAKPNDSTLWKHLVKNWAYLDDHSFSSRKYNGTGPRCNLQSLTNGVPQDMLSLKVSDLVDSSGAWFISDFTSCS